MVFVLSCANSKNSFEKSKYDSESLAQEWRSNVKEKSLNKGYGHNYPQDNDSDYVYPVRQHNTPQEKSAPNVGVESYPQDNDSNYENNYPTYDPDADNSGYYYMNSNKRLPKAAKQPDSGEYNYPIYFD